MTLLALLLAVACSAPAYVVEPIPDPGDNCAAAEDTLHRLQCRRDDGTPRWLTPRGATFAEACRAAMEDGRNWNPRCIAAIDSCDQLEPAFHGQCP